MGILDQLLEKKDVLAYIDYRIELLKIEQNKAIENVGNEYRQAIKNKFYGRRMELVRLRETIHSNSLKVVSKSMSSTIENGRDD
jgi:hypothetical protein